MRLIRSCRNALAVCAGVVGLLAALAAPARAIPSFARQTKLPCSACHTQFPELNAFGRVFKLNGYTLRMIETIEAGDTLGHQDLSINLMPLPSVMVQASETYTQRPQGATTNGTVSLPQQLSVFLAGAITPKQLSPLGASAARNLAVTRPDRPRCRYERWRFRRPSP